MSFSTWVIDNSVVLIICLRSDIALSKSSNGLRLRGKHWSCCCQVPKVIWRLLNTRKKNLDFTLFGAFGKFLFCLIFFLFKFHICACKYFGVRIVNDHKTGSKNNSWFGHPRHKRRWNQRSFKLFAINVWWKNDLYKRIYWLSVPIKWGSFQSEIV